MASVVRFHDRGNGPQPLDGLSGVIKPTHMRVAGGEIAIWLQVAGILLDREEEFRHSLVEPPSKGTSTTHYRKRVGDTGARAEAQRGLNMLDRIVGLARPNPERSADRPATRKIRVEREGTVDQRHHRADVLAEISQRKSGIHQDSRIVTGHLQGSPGEIGSLQTARRRFFAPTVPKQPKTAVRGPGECGSITRIARDRLLKQVQRLGSLPCR